MIANPEAGILTVRATLRQHDKLQEFLDQVLVNAKRQVLIEVTIVDVQLTTITSRESTSTFCAAAPPAFSGGIAGAGVRALTPTGEFPHPRTTPPRASSRA